MDYPVEPDNDKKGKFGTALCEQGGFFYAKLSIWRGFLARNQARDKNL